MPTHQRNMFPARRRDEDAPREQQSPGQTHGRHAPPESRRKRLRRKFIGGNPRPGMNVAPLFLVLLVLGVAAFLLLPQFSNAHQQAREDTLKDELRYLRTQIAVFKAQHRDIPPGYENGDPSAFANELAFNEQMCQHTNINCEVNSSTSHYFQYGPYVGQIPANPVNGLNTVEFVQNNQPIPSPDGTTGWIYKPQTQEVIANVKGWDDQGTPYASY